MAKVDDSSVGADRPKTERLFGAAITKLRGEVLGLGAGYREILLGVLADLDLTEDEVDEYVKQNRGELMAALRKTQEEGT